MKHIIYFFFLCVLFSCKSEERIIALTPLNKSFADSAIQVKEHIPYLELKNKDAICISVPEGVNMLYKNTLIDDYSYIPLETTDDCLIGEISKLCTDSSFFFVFDKRNNTVFRFSEQGKFLGRISNRGRGPQEYTELQDVSLDKERKEVCLLDLGSQKLLFYDYGGVFLREEPIYYFFLTFEFWKSKMVLNTWMSTNSMYPGANYNRLLVTERNQEPLYKGFSYPAHLRRQFHLGNAPYSLCAYDKEVFYNHSLSDTIWQIEEGSCEAEYILKFKNRDNFFDDNDFQNITDESFHSRTNRTQRFCGKYLVMKDFVLFGITNEKNVIETLVYDKTTGNVVCGMLLSNHDAKSLGIRLISLFDFVVNDTAVAYVLQPFDIVKRVKEMSPEQKLGFTKKDNALLKDLKEEDNPVLLVATLKHFQKQRFWPPKN